MILKKNNNNINENNIEEYPIINEYKYLGKQFLTFLISCTLCLNLNKFNCVQHPLINPICFLFINFFFIYFF